MTGGVIGVLFVVGREALVLLLPGLGLAAVVDDGLAVVVVVVEEVDAFINGGFWPEELSKFPGFFADDDVL